MTGLKMHRCGVAVLAEGLAERQVLVTASTATVDRVGDSVDPAGLDLTSYKSNPVSLWNHDHDKPIAKCATIDLVGDELKALIEFPDEGVDGEADRVYRLIKAGIVNAVSIGFRIIKATARDGKDPKKGLAIAQSELYEISFVAVPANPDALIEERSLVIKGLTMANKTATPTTLKGMYEVSQLANILGALAWLEDCVEWEAEVEGDGSEIPKRLVEAMAALGQVLIDMTVEEVTELTRAEMSGEDAKAFFVGKVKAVLATGDKEARSHHRKMVVNLDAKALDTAIAKALADARAEAGLVTVKSGRVLSKASRGKIEEACKSIQAGYDMLTGLIGDDTDEGDGEAEADEKSAAAIARRKRIARVRQLAAVD